MTKEKRAERKKEREELSLKYPHSVLGKLHRDTNGVWRGVRLILEERDQAGIIVFDGNQSRNVFLENIDELGHFIHALVARYNAMVEISNETARETKMEQLAPIDL